MKSLMGFVLAIFLSLGSLAHANDLKFEWDSHPQANQVSEFRLYSGSPGEEKTLALTIPGGDTTTASLTVAEVGERCFDLTAIGGGLESGKSNEVCVQLPPRAPGGLKVTVKVEIEMSN